MKRFRSIHLGRVIHYHIMMYISSRYLKARSVFPILSTMCETSIMKPSSVSLSTYLSNHKRLAGSSSWRPRVSSVPSSLQARKWQIHRWCVCNMGNSRASKTHGGFEGVTRGFKKVETGFFKSGNRLPQGWRRAASG